MAQNRKNSFNVARKEAYAFCGELIAQLARLEQSLVPALVLASTLPAYADVAKKPAHLFGKRIDQLRQIIETDGPLKKSAGEIIANLDELSWYVEARNLLAHATLEIVQTESEELHYIFLLTQPGKENSVEKSKMIVSKAEAKSILSTLKPIVEKLTRQLDGLGKPQRAKITQLPVATVTPQCRAG